MRHQGSGANLARLPRSRRIYRRFSRRISVCIAESGHRFFGGSEGPTGRICLVKVMIDECIDWRLARDIVGHDVKTARQMGWTTIKNGELLALGTERFDVFVTVDRNLAFQQNLAAFSIAVIVLRARTNRLEDLKPLVPNLLHAIESARSAVGPLPNPSMQRSRRLRARSAILFSWRKRGPKARSRLPTQS